MVHFTLSQGISDVALVVVLSSWCVAAASDYSRSVSCRLFPLISVVDQIVRDSYILQSTYGVLWCSVQQEPDKYFPFTFSLTRVTGFLNVGWKQGHQIL